MCVCDMCVCMYVLHIDRWTVWSMLIVFLNWITVSCWEESKPFTVSPSNRSLSQDSLIIPCHNSVFWLKPVLHTMISKELLKPIPTLPIGQILVYVFAYFYLIFTGCNFHCEAILAKRWVFSQPPSQYPKLEKQRKIFYVMSHLARV